jgi:hypothetical protein
MITIKDTAECVALATQLKREWFPHETTWGPWFRGHSDVTWKLTPKLYHVKPPKRGIRIIEDEIRQEFIMRAPGLSDIGPLTSWEWYCMMQHFGAPTRLLDWTEGALIALYFAVRDNNGDSDSAIWILDPWWLNKRGVKEREVIPPGAEVGISTPDSDRYQSWLPARYSTDQLPEPCVAIYPTHSARRISTQRSCFTIHGSDEAGLESLTGEPDAHIAKVTIPRSEVLSIREQLAVAGVDEITIFPDLDGLGRYLNAVLVSEADAI